MKSILAKQQQFNSPYESRSLDIQQANSSVRQEKILSDISDNTKLNNAKIKNVVDAMADDKKIQIASLVEAGKTDKDIKSDDKKLLSAVDKLSKTFEKSNSNIVKLYEEAKKQTTSLKSLSKQPQLTDASAKAITDKALGRDQFKTIGERVGDVKSNIKDFFTVKGFLNKTGIIDPNSNGVFANAINRRQARMDYIEDRNKVDPQQVTMAAGKLAKADGKVYKELSDSEKLKYKKLAQPSVNESFGKKFDQQLDVEKKMRANEKEIKTLQGRGYSEEQLERSGLMKTRRDLAEQYSKVNTQVKADVAYTGLAEKVSTKRTSESTDSEEVANENQRIIDEQLNVLKEISDTATDIKSILQKADKKKDKEESKEEPQPKKGLFDTAKEALGSLGLPGGSKGGKKIPKGAKGIGSLGGKLLKGAKGFGIGTVLGIGGDLVADALGRDTKGGATADVLGSTASYAGTGAMIGSVIPGVGTAIGAGVGGLIGAGKGLYDNWGTLFGSKGDQFKVATPGAASTVYGVSNENAAIKEALSKQTSQNTVIAPVTNNTSNTQVTKYDLPVKKNDDSLNRYTGSRLAY